MSRDVVLERAFNLRDLGGYDGLDGRSVRWGRLYRGASLQHLRGADAERVAELGARVVVDLRTPGEVAKPAAYGGEPGARWLHLPMQQTLWDLQALGSIEPVDAFLAARYDELLTTGATTIRAVLELLAEEERYPLVFFCAAGKDRTGTLAALILALLGVGDDDIAADYALSRDRVEQLVAFLRSIGKLDERGIDQPQKLRSSPPEAMLRLLRGLRERHGSIEAFVAGLGVSDDVVAAVRERLLT